MTEERYRYVKNVCNSILAILLLSTMELAEKTTKRRKIMYRNRKNARIHHDVS
jgi:hypothetical protein